MPGLNETEVIEVKGFRIGLMHGHQIVPWGDTEALQIFQRQLDVDILVTGHTHKLDIQCINGKYFLNPGSATGAYSPLVENPIPSFILLQIKEGSLNIFKYTLEEGEINCEPVTF